MDAVIYEESPRYDSLFKGLLVLPVFFIIFGIYYLYIGEVEAGIGMFAVTVLMFAAFWAVFPRKYQVLDSKLKIVLGGPFSLSVPFDNLETARKPQGATFGINFPTCFSSDRVVAIVRKKGWNINITPNDRDLFLENLDKALQDWRRSSKQ
jgi:hypothetical protein